jgi:hypothetical protein
MIRQQTIAAQGGPSSCPDLRNPATGVVTDHAMLPPFNWINIGS